MKGRLPDDSSRLMQKKASLMKLQLSELDLFPKSQGADTDGLQGKQEQMVALTELKRWCVRKFGGEETAFRALSGHVQDVDRCVDEKEFLAALQRHDYPADEAGQQALFRILASKERSSISYEDFIVPLENIWIGNSFGRHSTPLASEPLNMDPFEAACLTKTGSVARTKAQIFGRLRKSDPPIAELLEFMFAAFGTLRMAFRQMDINGNGMLSTSEFADCMRDIRSKTGERPVESHMLNLFHRLQQSCGGLVTLEKMIQLLDTTDDPMLSRLLKFITEIRKKALGDSRDDLGKMPHFMRIFKVAHRGGEISRDHFCRTLSNLRYHEWHAVELFKRLDVDGSGNLTIAEFTAFLEATPDKKVRKGPCVPLGSEHRRKQVEIGHVSCNDSYKLAHIGTHRTPSATPKQDLDPRDPNTPFLRAVARPIDWVESVRSQTQRRYDTELSRKGHHVFQMCREPLLDVCDIGAGLEKFDCKKERCRITAF